jgi:methylated-DNA-protein-cysteine methyltransferase-like protein
MMSWTHSSGNIQSIVSTHEDNEQKTTQRVVFCYTQSMKGQFSQRLWELAISIPPGRVTTYGGLAKAAGSGGQASRSVSGILAKSPNPGVIPWHRIVYAGGKVWLTDEYSAKRRELYELEGIVVNDKGYIKDFEEILFDFSELT